MHLCLTSESFCLFHFSLSLFLSFCFHKDIQIFSLLWREMGTSLKIYGFLLSLFKHLIADFIYCVSYSILHSTPPFYLQTLFKSLVECRYLTNLPVYSHSKVWIQDIPHKFHLFLLYSHLKIYVLLQLITGFFFLISYFVWLYQRREYFIDTHLPHLL